MTPYLKILKNVLKPHWFEIIRLIKCSPGLSVGELSEKLEMSYMGVKKHCLALEKLGYLDTWRRPKVVGRPEKSYRVTEKLGPLFPGIGNDVSLAILDAATQLEPNAAEKLLFAFFREQTGTLVAKVSGESVQGRAERLAAARAAQGYFSICEYSDEEGLRIEEFHNPLQPLFEKYPTLARMEVQMFEKLLRARVVRSSSKVSGLTHYRFDLSPR
ncbi:MAG: winged helix-turn-helix transcriptional regulator [Verrucomicrobiales bacterium]|nr:winged helix-turn-helix transcriptional regulator [Verrucomicrobiales bacterium]